MARRNDYPFHKLRKSDFGVVYPLFMLSAILCVIVGFVAFLPFALPFIYIFKNDRISELWQVKERHKILFIYLCSLLTILTPIACMLFYIYSKEEVPFIYVLWVALIICNLSLCLLVIEVESSGYKIHASLDAFCLKYSSRIKERYLIYTKDFAREEETFYVPAYMTPLL